MRNQTQTLPLSSFPASPSGYVPAAAIPCYLVVPGPYTGIYCWAAPPGGLPRGEGNWGITYSADYLDASGTVTTFTANKTFYWDETDIQAAYNAPFSVYAMYESDPDPNPFTFDPSQNNGGYAYDPNSSQLLITILFPANFLPLLVQNSPGSVGYIGFDVKIAPFGHASGGSYGSYTPNYVPYPDYYRRYEGSRSVPFPGKTNGPGGTPALKQPGALTVDGPRQWLHVARAKAKTVTTYHAADSSVAFTSPSYAVDYFAALRTDPRRGRLHLLAFSGANALVFRSSDGGMTSTQVLSVKTTNAVLEVLSEKGIVLLLSTDAATAGTAGNVSAQMSADGGNTWGSAAPSVNNGARLVAVLSDVTYDPRRNALDLLCTVGSNTVVLQSQDVGLTWVQKL